MRLCRSTVRKGSAFPTVEFDLSRGYASITARRSFAAVVNVKVPVRQSLTAVCGGKAAVNYQRAELSIYHSGDSIRCTLCDGQRPGR